MPRAVWREYTPSQEDEDMMARLERLERTLRELERPLPGSIGAASSSSSSVPALATSSAQSPGSYRASRSSGPGTCLCGADLLAENDPG